MSKFGKEVLKGLGEAAAQGAFDKVIKGGVKGPPTKPTNAPRPMPTQAPRPMPTQAPRPMPTPSAKTPVKPAPGSMVPPPGFKKK